jgi:hypothetical protein
MIDGIEDESIKNVVGRYGSFADLGKGMHDLRAKLSTAINIPGEGASEEEIGAYNKAMNVPDSPEGYEFTPFKDDYQWSETDLAFQGVLRDIFHGTGTPKPLADKLNSAFNNMQVQLEEAQVEADKKYLEEAESGLKKKWGPDYDRNSNLAGRAAKFMLGDNFENVSQLELKDGTLMLDHPALKEAFATAGLQMDEGSFEIMTPDQQADLDTQISTLGNQIREAYDAGKTDEANRLSEEQRKLYAMKGNKSAVGHDGRTA